MWRGRFATPALGASSAVLLIIGACGGDPKTRPAHAAATVSDSGIRLGDAPATPYPGELEHRTVLRGALVNPSDADNYVGYVLTFYGTPTPSGGCVADSSRPPRPSIKRYIKQNAAPIATEAISQIWYQSLVSDSAHLALQYLASSISLANNQRAEVVIEDVAKAEVSNSDIDYDALSQLANRKLNQGECDRLMIRAAYLTSVKSRIFNRTGADASAGYLAFKADGAYYTSSDQISSNLVLAIDGRGLEELTTQSPADSGLRTPDLRTRIVIPPGGLKLPALHGVVLRAQ